MIIQEIRNLFSEFSDNQKAIGTWMLENSENIPFQTVKSLAEKCNVSTASIVRFSQKLGYEGFPGLKEAFIDELQNQGKTQVIKTGLKNLFNDVPHQDIETIKKTFKKLNPEIFDEVINLISSSETIHICGLGISFLAGEILAYQLKQVGFNASLMSTETLTFKEQLYSVKPNDCIISFSFPPYSLETIELVEKADKLNLKTICITDSEAAPVSFFTKHTLLAESENFIYINSLTGIVCLINTIVTACTANDKKRAEAVIKFNSRINKI